MKMKVQLVIEDESGGTTTTDLVDIERGAEGLIGLSLAEAKALNARVQHDFERWHPQLAQKAAPRSLAA